MSTIPDNVLEAAQTLVNRDPIEQLPQALRTLREHTGLTQDSFAQKLHIQRSSVAGWENGLKVPVTSRTAAILRVAGLGDQFNSLVPSDKRKKLDADAYKNCDADSLEYDFFLRTRGEVLEKVRTFALTGNSQAARLYMDWMYRNEQRMSARVSTAVSLSNDTHSLRNRALQVVSKPVEIEQLQVVDSATPTVPADSE